MKKSRSAYGPWTFMRKRSPVLEFPTPYTKRLEMTSNSEGPSLIRFARSGDSPFIRFGKRLSNSPIILENNEKMNNRKIRTVSLYICIICLYICIICSLYICIICTKSLPKNRNHIYKIAQFLKSSDEFLIYI